MIHCLHIVCVQPLLHLLMVLWPERAHAILVILDTDKYIAEAGAL